MAEPGKIGFVAATLMVAGTIMGSGIFMLSANLGATRHRHLRFAGHRAGRGGDCHGAFPIDGRRGRQCRWLPFICAQEFSIDGQRQTRRLPRPPRTKEGVPAMTRPHARAFR
ncbi:hypothetical protein CH75_10005 [Dyella jiangningensis]|nr:hypothetical protein CH75_10005 [Dyella jiangningensis]